MNELKIVLKPFQNRFFFSERRFPALIAGIGTGKTMMLLLKVWKFCLDYPDSLALIVRKEYTDLRDSTIKDFEQYFKVKVDSNKEYPFKNGSVIMFRHGAELNVLKNINLSIFGMEQAEEFETDEPFTFLRDRLRRGNSPFRQGCVIGNTKGHNWIWRLWKNNPQDEFELVEANTFMNKDNLPADFITDLRRMEIESPNHYKQYVMNSWEEIEGDDYLFDWETLNRAANLESGARAGKKAIGLDVARFGDDETVFTVIENRGANQWEQTFLEAHKQKDLMWTTGRYIDLRREVMASFGRVDDDGLGGGVTDRLKELGIDIDTFRGGTEAKNKELYGNKRTEGYFNLKEMIEKGYLKILNNHDVIDQLLTIRYKYNSKGQRLIVSKDDMRKEGLKSPDRADALMMACYNLKSAMGERRDFIPQTRKRY